MGQITKATIAMIRAAAERNEPPALTAWEYQQLAHMAERCISTPSALPVQAVGEKERLVHIVTTLRYALGHPDNIALADEALRILALAAPMPQSAGWVSDEILCRLADRLWEEGHISDLSKSTAVIYARAVLALAPGLSGWQPQPEPQEASKSERPSPEWYARKTQETLDDDFITGASKEASKVGPAAEGEPVSEEIAVMLGERVAFLRDPAVYRGKYWNSMTNEQRKQAFAKLDGGAAGFRQKLWTWKHFDMGAEDIGMAHPSPQALSDEEIRKLWEESGADWLQSGRNPYLRFARAVLAAGVR